MTEYSDQTKARIRTLMGEGATRAAAACVTCGCDPADHFEPDWYDPRTQAADEDGHLNHCGNCAGCFSPEYEGGVRMTLYRHAEELAAEVVRLTRERDAAMEALKRIKAMSAVAGYDFGDVTIHNVARQTITAIETGAIHDA